MRKQLFGVLLVAVAVVATGGNLVAVDCSNDACCVNAATCVVTDLETLNALTLDQVISCNGRTSSWVSGGGVKGLAPANWPANLCGLSFSINSFTAPQAYNFIDHKWLQSTTVPKVSDFGIGTPVNTVIVFPAVDHGPFPQEGIESTVWGRTDSSSTAGFPAGWTLATLTTIWKKGWEEPAACDATPDNADDYTGQYSFPGVGFRYIAVHADFSISIFDDAAHTTWSGSSDDSGVPGWQSHDDEIDAVGTPFCDAGIVTADAGPDQDAIVGDQICFNASGSSGAIVNYGWNLDGDSTIDASGVEACFTCTEEGEGDVRLFVSDDCGCVDSDTAHFTCTPCDPDPRSQGYWHRQCLGVSAAEGGIDPGRNGRGPQEPTEPNFTKDLMPAVDALLQNDLFLFGSCSEGMDADPPSDPCQRATKQYTALLFNLETDRLQTGCRVDASAEGCGSLTVGDLVAELTGLINAGECGVAASCAAAVNTGTALTEAAVAGLVVQTDRATETATDLTGGHSSVRTDVSPQADLGTAAEPVTESSVVLVAPALEPVEVVVSEEAVIEEIATEFETIRRHLSVMANPSAPERATNVSRDSLLTTLSGGFDPELRLEIVKALIHRVDASYHALLAAHLEDIRSEAVDFGKDDLASEAERLLKRLDSTGK